MAPARSPLNSGELVLALTTALELVPKYTRCKVAFVPALQLRLVLTATLAAQLAGFGLLAAPARIAAGSTKSVMLCAGTVLLKPLSGKLRSPSRLMALADVNCQTWAVPFARKLLSVTDAVALDVSCLLMTISVSAPSEERTAANVATLSGFGPVAETLVSPKVDLLPS